MDVRLKELYKTGIPYGKRAMSFGMEILEIRKPNRSDFAKWDARLTFGGLYIMTTFKRVEDIYHDEEIPMDGDDLCLIMDRPLHARITITETPVGWSGEIRYGRQGKLHLVLGTAKRRVELAPIATISISGRNATPEMLTLELQKRAPSHVIVLDNDGKQFNPLAETLSAPE